MAPAIFQVVLEPWSALTRHHVHAHLRGSVALKLTTANLVIVQFQTAKVEISSCTGYDNHYEPQLIRYVTEHGWSDS